MAEHDGVPEQPPRTMADALARFTTPARKQRDEDIEFWRNASDELRGEIFFGLLGFASAVGHFPEKRERFPGFPKPQRTAAG